MNMRPGIIVLADGSVFEGELFGAERPAAGEVVFNTALSGYQEVLTDPSYAGQIVTFTNPHIGNYGVNATDFESRGLFCRGVVVRDLARRHSNRRAEADLDSMLRAARRRRHHGSRHAPPDPPDPHDRRGPGRVRTAEDVDALRTRRGRRTRHRRRRPRRHRHDRRAVHRAGRQRRVWRCQRHGARIVAYDYGIKRTILRHLAGWGPSTSCRRRPRPPTCWPGSPTASSCPTGPAIRPASPVPRTIIGELLGSSVPVFGICLGHQLLATAIGGTTVKLPFGHHGANHPVQDVATGKIEITSQNHNFAVAADDLAGIATMTHVNLNDGVCEGLEVTDANAFAVQHHPEAGPGPHDSAYLFERFADRMAGSLG